MMCAPNLATSSVRAFLSATLIKSTCAILPYLFATSITPLIVPISAVPNTVQISAPAL